jgi:putative transposase
MRAAVLRPGDWVRYDGADHQVIALAGTSVRLRSDVGAESVVLVAYLMASPEFAVIDGAPTPSVEPFGLMDGLPVKALEQAREWERHIVEVETGLPPGALPGATPRAGFDPASTTIAERDQAKAAELGVSLRTVKTRRARYTQQGLWGLVDQRAVRLSGLVRKFVGGHAARGCVGWWSSLASRSSRSVVVNFHLNGRAVWL